MRELLARPNGWTQGFAARSATGEPIHFASSNAVCYCLVGASWVVNGCRSGVHRGRTALQYFLGVRDIIDWNDEHGRTQAEVLAAIDGTIEGLGG